MSSTSPCVVRFAPSPTGYLHIGSARTALFNWLFARHYGGKFLLRIEDTDRLRSTQEAVDAIFESLSWLGLDFDEEPLFQCTRIKRHQEVAHDLLKIGKAYYCYCTPKELEEMREMALKEGRSPRYDGQWRDADLKDKPEGVLPVVRLKMPRDGFTLIHDLVQGDVSVNNSELDDMVLLRADGTPTYMLSVVVDDHDMGITHIIRGDDHLTNAFRQKQLFLACGFDVPHFAHIPLIHGSDGAKLSKRHGAIGTYQYRDLGFLKEAMCNYFLRLGFSHGDDEIIPLEKAIEWFDLGAVGRSASRFDMNKLLHLNAHYMRQKGEGDLIKELIPFLKKHAETTFPNQDSVVFETGMNRILRGLKGLKERSKTLDELAMSSLFYLSVPPLDEAAHLVISKVSSEFLRKIEDFLKKVDFFEEKFLFARVKEEAIEWEVKVNDIAQPLRAILTGRTVSPSLFEVMEVLGREEVLKRVADTISLFG